MVYIVLCLFILNTRQTQTHMNALRLFSDLHTLPVCLCPVLVLLLLRLMHTTQCTVDEASLKRHTREFGIHSMFCIAQIACNRLKNVT